MRSRTRSRPRTCWASSQLKALIVYDLDGTLVDTLEDIAAAANHMRRQLGEPPLAAEDIRGSVGRGLRELVRHCLQTDEGPRIEQGMSVYRAYYGAHLLDRSRLYPGAREVLEHFRGRRQAVVTNKPDPYSRDILRGLGVDGYFGDVIAGDAGFPKKPDPAGLRALLEKHRLGPAAALFIGDSPIDVETGRSAGVLTVCVAHGLATAEELRRARPDAVAEDFGGLLRLAAERGW
jgi:phosphoglycolate phosphatase